MGSAQTAHSAGFGHGLWLGRWKRLSVWRVERPAPCASCHRPMTVGSVVLRVGNGYRCNECAPNHEVPLPYHIRPLYWIEEHYRSDCTVCQVDRQMYEKMLVRRRLRGSCPHCHGTGVLVAPEAEGA